MPVTMPASRAARTLIALFPLLAALLVAGCGGTEPAPGKTLDISPSMRAGCPEHPFKPEFQGASARLAGGGPAAGKTAAETGTRAGYPFQVEIYDNGGDLVVEWSGILDPQDLGSAQSMLWAGTDSQGRPVPSGYYFVRARLEDAEGQVETRTSCIFYVNPDDNDKRK